MMRAKQKLIYFVLIPVFTLIAGIAFVKLRSDRPVAFATLKKGSIVEAVYGIGTVTSHKVYSVKVNQAGSVRNIYVAEGDLVKDLQQHSNRLAAKHRMHGRTERRGIMHAP